ncbi:MAG: hypothetical protein LBC19_15120 [Tannerella sp.]|jgi:hypothetical protein|nr:hypothetical protein [Tannerella sp.]
MKYFSLKNSLVKGIISTVMILSVCIFSCDDMNSIHEEYLKRGETLYIGGVNYDSVYVYSGDRKIKFEWKVSADPRITKTVIYWNNRDTSVVIPVNRTVDNEFWMETLITDIAEGEYIFEFMMQDDNNHTSIAVEISGTVFGQVYLENLRNRGIKELSKLETGEMQIIWETVNNVTLQYSVLEYIDDNGQPKKVNVPNSDDKTLLDGLDTGDEVELYAAHLPENALETLNSFTRTLTMPKFERELAKSRFAAAFKPGDNTTPQPGDSDGAWANSWVEADNRDIRQLWDNNPKNDAVNGRRGILHTADQSGNWANARFKYPHKFTIDLGVLATLSRIHVWPRVDAGAFTGHSPRYFEIWATDVPKEISDFGSQAEYEQYYRTTYLEHKNPDNQVQTNPNGDANHSGMEFIETPATGIYNWQQDWVKLGDFEFAKPSGMNYNQSNDADKAVWANGADFTFQEINKKVQYIRLVIKYPNWQNTNCINLGEITLYGDDV